MTLFPLEVLARNCDGDFHSYMYILEFINVYICIVFENCVKSQQLPIVVQLAHLIPLSYLSFVVLTSIRSELKLKDMSTPYIPNTLS